MEVMRNPEMKRQAIIYALFTTMAAAGAAFMSLPFAVCLLLFGLVSGLLFFNMAQKRYDEIASLSEVIDQILHDDEKLDFTPDKEGELAVLSSEIYKMTVRLREQAEALHKDKSYLKESIADISHQLRTPLTSMRIAAFRLQRANLAESERAELVCDLDRLLSRIEWLINTLLKISQLESGTVDFASVPVLMEEMVKMAVQPLEIPLELREIEVEFQMEQQPCYNGDQAWTVEAVGNIVKNCMEHTPKGGKIVLTGRENSIYTELVITDTGNGIAKEDLPHLFERFYKGQDSGQEGVGIGLALAAMIVKKQNGVILAENSTDPSRQGARFRIRFYKGAV